MRRLAALALVLVVGFGCCHQVPDHTIAPQRPVALAWK